MAVFVDAGYHAWLVFNYPKSMLGWHLGLRHR